MARKQRPITVGRIKHLVAQAEKADLAKGEKATNATGYTLLRMTSKPIARLIDDGAIGPAEYMAAQEFYAAFMAITGALWIKPLSMERQDRGWDSREPVKLIEAQERYRAFTRHWSVRAKMGDKTLAVVVAAVVDEHAFHIIEADIGLRHGKARKVLISGLRDYAARAGWVDHRTAGQWLEAEATFPAPHPVLSLAMARARVETTQAASAG